MKFTDVDDYQKFALTTAIYPDRGNNIVYPVLGLMGESGEVAEKVKKVIRDKGGKLTDEDKVNIALELSDTLWYTATIASELGFNLSEIFQKNIDKLSSRKERGVLSGSGDNR
jgi:NTP pyrophosphatase (non-canonical NTP hydrolase)